MNKPQWKETAQVLLRDASLRADCEDFGEAHRLAKRALRLMKPHYSNNNPDLAAMHATAARYAFAMHEDMSEHSIFGGRQWLGKAIAAKKEAINILNRGMVTQQLLAHRLELSAWLGVYGWKRESMRVLKAVVSAAQVIEADEDFLTAARLALVVKLRGQGKLPDALAEFKRLPPVYAQDLPTMPVRQFKHARAILREGELLNELNR
jgi:hypothetical protein